MLNRNLYLIVGAVYLIPVQRKTEYLISMKRMLLVAFNIEELRIFPDLYGLFRTTKKKSAWFKKCLSMSGY